VRVAQIAEGLWRWTARAQDDAEELAAAYLETPAAVVLIDPVLPPPDSADRERFWRALDRDVGRAGPAVHVVRTHPAEGAAAALLLARYPGAVLWQPGDGAPPPCGIEPREVPGGDGEAVIWLRAHRTLVASRVLAGAADGRGLQVAAAAPPVLALLDTLARMPVERVLVARGEPVLDGAVEALRAAVQAARQRA
jgi:hypothetical protein